MGGQTKKIAFEGVPKKSKKKKGGRAKFLDRIQNSWSNLFWKVREGGLYDETLCD